MDPQTYDRWLEVSFYYFCQDILEINNDLMDVMDLVESLAPIGKYEVEPIKGIIQEVLVTYRLRPTREELALLLYKNKTPVQEIKEHLKIGNQKLYKLVEADRKDPRVFYPRLSVHNLAIIKKFLDTIEKIRKAGI